MQSQLSRALIKKKKTTNSYADKVAAVKMDSLNEFSGPFQLVTLWKYCIRHKRLLHKIQQLPCKEAILFPKFSLGKKVFPYRRDASSCNDVSAAALQITNTTFSPTLSAMTYTEHIMYAPQTLYCTIPGRRLVFESLQTGKLHISPPFSMGK